MSITSIRRFIRRARHRTAESFIAPPEAFASHLPILIGLAGILRVRKVLELGCGTFSTPTLLSRRCFPHLEKLDSLETERTWIEKAAEIVGRDPRWTPTAVGGSMASCIPDLNLENYDLVLVDDSHSYEERARTIRAIAERKPPTGLYLIHDFEAPVYQTASRKFAYRFTFDALLPNTGANWNQDVINSRHFTELNNKIRSFAQNLKSLDVTAWYSALRQSEN